MRFCKGLEPIFALAQKDSNIMSLVLISKSWIKVFNDILWAVVAISYVSQITTLVWLYVLRRKVNKLKKAENLNHFRPLTALDPSSYRK